MRKSAYKVALAFTILSLILFGVLMVIPRDYWARFIEMAIVSLAFAISFRYIGGSFK